MKFKYLRAIASEGTVTWDSLNADNSAPADIDGFLDTRGSEGWELVSVTEVEAPRQGFKGSLLGETTFFQELFFKRAVPD